MKFYRHEGLIKGIRTYTKAARASVNNWKAAAGWSVKQLRPKAQEWEEKLVFKEKSSNGMCLAKVGDMKKEFMERSATSATMGQCELVKSSAKSLIKAP